MRVVLSGMTALAWMVLAADPISGWCSTGYYECQYNGQCIPDYRVCDGYDDCYYYHDDENDCDATDNPPSECPDDEYECIAGNCIPEYWVCDGTSDCPIYGDDEDDCFIHDYTTTSTTTTTTTTTTTRHPTTPPPIECKSPFDYIHDRCVFVDPFTSNSWEEARYFCQKFDSDLVVLDDFNFYGKLLQYINDAGIEEHDYWVGARDQLEGVWRWVDDTPVHVGAPLWALYGCTNDYNLEPRASEADHQDCGYLDTSRGLYMSDAYCDEKYAAICQGQRASTAEQETGAQEPAV